ncbi:MAG: Spy/CpxP family protein refolding chaperone [Syntrophales bacterium]|nr:Spy/CpxP family protein refolding chaperone [Syntrophales bacterium]
MKKIGLAMMVSLLVLGLAVTTYAWGGPGGRGFPGRGPGFDGPFFDIRMIPDLKLTAEQEAKIDALRLAHLKETKPLRDKMFSLSGDLRILWMEKVPDEAKINAVQKELRAVRDQIWDKTTAYIIKVREVLTPEQQQKLSAYRWFSPGPMGMGRRGHGGWYSPPGTGEPPFGPGPCWR